MQRVSTITSILVGLALLADPAVVPVLVQEVTLASTQPNFQIPFPCGERWKLTTYNGHGGNEYEDKRLDMYWEDGEELGKPVLAAADGEVQEWTDPGGIEIDHGGGHFTLYLHMRTRLVEPGDKVVQGQKIGEVGDVETDAAHLHYEQRYDTDGSGNSDNSEIVNAVFDGQTIRITPETDPFPVLTSKNCPDSGPSTPGWYLSNVLEGSRATVPLFKYGSSTMVALPGDWNGDGGDTAGMYDPATRTFHLRNTNTTGKADTSITYGNLKDVPLKGDWNGDGSDDIGVYRPATRQFFRRLPDGKTLPTLVLGNPRDIPLAGNFTGDRKAEIGVYRPSTRTFYLADEQGRTRSSTEITFGNLNDHPLIGDWDGDGSDDIGVYRPATRQFFYRFPDTTVKATSYGNLRATPITGDWDDKGGDTQGVLQ